MSNSTSPLMLRVSLEQRKLIDQLVYVGLHGNSRAAVVRTLVTRGLEQAIKDGLISVKGMKPVK